MRQGLLLSIFQKSILNSIKQDESLIALRWNNFQNYVAKIDKEIDAMVYTLYGLSEDEIKTVEGR